MARQITIDEEQARLLERRARELGVGEDELVRRLLDVALRNGGEPETRPDTPPSSGVNVPEAIPSARITVGGVSFPREELYEERESRWFPK